MMADAVAEFAAAPSFAGDFGDGVVAAAEGVAAGATFAYRVAQPVRVGRFESAMVPIVVATIEAHEVSFFDAAVLPDHPLRGVRLVNDTGLHLAAGPVTLFDAGGFAGQALLPDVVPGDSRVLTYAVDLEVAADVDSSTEPEQVVAASLRGGVLESTWRTRIVTRYHFEARGDGDRFVVVEHPKRAGFDVVDPVDPTETPTAWRSGVAVGDPEAGDPTVPTHLTCDGDGACVLTVTMVRLDGRRLALSNVGSDQIAFYLENVELSEADREALASVLEVQRRIVDIDRSIVALDTRVNDVFRDQSRIRDNMSALERNSTLYRRYAGDLETQENELRDLRQRIVTLRDARSAAQQEFERLIERLGSATGD